MRFSKVIAQVGLIATVINASPFPYFDLQNCNVNNPVLQILSSRAMSQFCSSFLAISTSGFTTTTNFFATISATTFSTVSSTSYLATTTISDTSTTTTTGYT